MASLQQSKLKAISPKQYLMHLM